MKTKPELLVTLSEELLDDLRARARELRVPLKYVVASLICDTIDPVTTGVDKRSSERNYHVA
jgi:hypothetical protein